MTIEVNNVFPNQDLRLIVDGELKQVNSSEYLADKKIIHKKTNQYYLPRFALNENYGKIDRFIFSANTKPLIIENFLPNEILLKKNTIPKIQFDLISKINNSQLNCFSNSGGKWGSVNIKVDQDNRVVLNLTEPFFAGRGRLNCTTKVDKDWLWFGYQFTID